MMGSLVTINLKLQYEMKRDGDVWLARCCPLDIVTQSGTESGALTALREAIDLWFESCLERGVLDAALREAGFTKLVEGDLPSRKGAAPSVDNGQEPTSPQPTYLEVSIPAYVADQLDSQTRATR